MGCLDIPRSYTASGTGPTVLCGGSVSCCGERKSWDHCVYSICIPNIFHYISKNPTLSKQILFLSIFKTHCVAWSHDALAFRCCFSGRQNLMGAICWRLVRRGMKLYRDAQHSSPDEFHKMQNVTA